MKQLVLFAEIVCGFFDSFVVGGSRAARAVSLRCHRLRNQGVFFVICRVVYLMKVGFLMILWMRKLVSLMFYLIKVGPFNGF